MKVLSLFDGIACGREALRRLGLDVERYVAYEIEPSAIKIAKKNFPDIEERGDVFKADYKEFKGFDLLIGGSPCFTKGHLVLTNEGYKPIENIQVGDMVYTHKDRFKPVTAIGHKQSHDVYRVSSQGTEDFFVTGNHPFYVSDMKREWNNDRRCYDRVFSDPHWVQIQDVTKGAFFASPMLQIEENPLGLTEEDCWILGRYLADGHIRLDKRKGRVNSYNYAVVLSIGSHKLDDFLKHVKSYHVTHYPHSKSVERCCICSQEWVERILSLGLGRSCYEKTVPTSLLTLPKRLCMSLVEGYMSGDGSLDKTWKSFHACTTSKSLAYSMALLIQKVYGVNCGVKSLKSRGLTGTIEGRTVKLNQQWSLTFNKEMKRQSVAHVDGSKVYTPFKSKCKSDDAIVYNISVADDESYICNNRVVHNCTNWSIAKAGHGRETTNSGIGWELFSQYIRAWKESGVKYYLYENNASMSPEIREAISEAFGHAPLEINSALVSAQTRKRLYWTNIPKACVPQDMGIKLSDILEHGVVDRDKSLCLARRYAGFQGSLSYLCRRYFGKSMGQAAFELNGGTIQDLKDLYKSNDRFTDEEGKATGCVIRPLTETECERLQTLPDGYTDGAGCTRIQRIEAIGNGWTVNVIVHLMQGLLQVDYSRLEELADPKAEPGFVYSSHSMQPIGNLTDEDSKQLSDICEICGEPIVNIKNAVADKNEKLHPICWHCDLRLRLGIVLRDMMRIAGVNDVDELINWIKNNKKYLNKPEFMR